MVIAELPWTFVFILAFETTDSECLCWHIKGFRVIIRDYNKNIVVDDALFKMGRFMIPRAERRMVWMSSTRKN